MIDGLRPAEASTNGNHAVIDSQEPSTGAPTPDGRTVDERLEALLHTIRSWDWRKNLVESDRLRDIAATATVTSATTSTSDDAPKAPASRTAEHSEQEVSEEFPGDQTPETQPMRPASGPRHAAVESALFASSKVERSITDVSLCTPPQPERDTHAAEDRHTGATDAEAEAEATLTEFNAAFAPLSTATGSNSSHGDTGPLVVDETPYLDPPDKVEPTLSVTLAPSTASMTVPTENVAGSAEPVAETEPDETHAETAEVKVQNCVSEEAATELSGVNETTWFGPEPEAEPEPDNWLRPLWSHPTVKLTLFIVVAALLVLGIIVGIRHFAKNNSGSGPSLTTVTRPASHATHHPAFVAPISSAALSQYEGYATALQNGNAAASTGIANAGSTPTVSQLALVVVAYRTVVNDYNYNLHLIKWPASMGSAIAAESGQLASLANYLQSFGSVGPTGVPGWLTQFHALTSTIQTDDNMVRRDLGLPAETSFP